MKLKRAVGMHNKEAMKITRSAQQGCDIVHNKKVIHYKEVTKFIKSAWQAPRKQHKVRKWWSSLGTQSTQASVPFLIAIARFFGPSYVLLQIACSNFIKTYLKPLENFLICCNILTCLRNNMSKMSPLKTFFQGQSFTTHNKF